VQVGDQRWRIIALALVRTATSSGDRALAAWGSLPDDFELDEIWGPELGRLLPAVGTRLTAAGSGDDALPRLAGAARKAWVEAQLESARWHRVVDALRTADVEVRIAGAGLLANVPWAYGGRPGERWTGDTRVVVRRRDVARAARALAAVDAMRRSDISIGRRAELLGGMPVQLDDDHWGELWWAPHPAWPVGSEQLEPGDVVSFAHHELAAVAAADVAVAACLDLEFVAPSLDRMFDLHRVVAATTAEVVAARGREVGAPGPVDRWLAVADRVGDHDDDRWIDHMIDTRSRRARARRAWAATSLRLGHGRAVVAAPRLLAERWHVDRVRQIPGAFAQRVGERTVGRVSRRG
jgi:hypothetical protein